jgi:replicative DNA helicase
VSRVAAVNAGQAYRFALAGDAEITDAVTGRVFMLGDVARGALVGGVHTLVNRQVIAAEILSGKMCGGVKPAVEVALASGRRITASAQHPLLTPDGWRPIGEIEPGETVALAGRIPPPLLPVPLPAAEVDLLAILLAEGGYTQLSVCLTTASPEILGLAARAAAELGMTVRRSDKYSYRLNGTGPDPAAAARGRGICWCGCGKPTLPSKSSWLAKGHRIGVPQRYAPGCKPRLLARQLLDRHGMGHEFARGKIPPRIFQVPDQQLARFLAIFWMCDGYVDGSPGLTLASERMVRQVQHLLLRFGIQSTVGPRRQGAHWRLRVPSPWWQCFLDALPIWGAKRERLEKLVRRSRGGVSVIGLPTFTAQLRQSLRAISDPDGFGTRVAPPLYVARNRRTGQRRAADVAARLGWTKFQFDRVFNKATNTICPAAFQAFCEIFGVTAHDWIWSAGIFWDRITSVTRAGEQEVYGLQVEPSRNFVASGLIVGCPGSL